jgi:hypothetical protein
LSSVGAQDFATASGVFHVKLGHAADAWEAYMLQTLKAMDGKARRGWSANFLTSYSDPTRMVSHLYYADPYFVFDYRRGTCRRTSLFCMITDSGSSL